ncbi:MAG: alpha-L-arabinofuranosidase C-terminal domain-containing protein, partial [Armatimonadota bacterium]
YRGHSDLARLNDRYDKQDRSGPKIFVGEWATIEGYPTPNFHAALSDAAFLMGLERNSDLVVMEGYAPLMVNVNPGAWQWVSNLIGFDSLRSFGSPSYYVQTMFAQNTGDEVLPLSLSVPKAVLPKEIYKGRYGFGAMGAAEFKDLTVDGRPLSIDVSPGRWSVKDGVYTFAQAGGRGGELLAGDLATGDFDLKFKVRRTGANGGFRVRFHQQDDMHSWFWEVGRGNSSIRRHEVFENDLVGNESPFELTTGQWYDVELKVADGVVWASIDGKPVHQVKEEPPATEPLYACATRDSASGDVIVKVVNLTGADVSVNLTLDGIGRVASASGWILTGEHSWQNSVTEPTKVSPQKIAVPLAAQSFAHTFPGSSLTVLRLKTR